MAAAELPDDVAEQALAFARIQLTDEAHPGRSGPAQGLTDHAPVIECLVTLLGRLANIDA